MKMNGMRERGMNVIVGPGGAQSERRTVTVERQVSKTLRSFPDRNRHPWSEHQPQAQKSSSCVHLQNSRAPRREGYRYHPSNHLGS